MMEDIENVACGYFLILSRLEYALKNSGFVVSGRKDTASPNWDGFIAHVHKQITLDYTDHEIKGFLENPPKKQLYKDGNLSWSSPQPIKKTDTQEALQACLTVRNNLFHGAKNRDGNADRNTMLINAATKILNQAIHICPHVNTEFLDSDL